MNPHSSQPSAAGEAAHTPTPWGDNNNCQFVSPSGLLIGDTGNGDQRTWAERRANAAFIVRACNSHAALVAALEEIDRRLSQQVDADTATWPEETCRDIARAALAAAKS